MLTGQLSQARRNSGLILIVLAGGLLIGVLIGVIFDQNGGSAHADRNMRSVAVSRSLRGNAMTAGVGATGSSTVARLPAATAGSNGTTAGQIVQRYILAKTLDAGVQEADALGGEAAAALWIYGDARPILAGPTSVLHRMWSMSKAVVTIAALKATNDQPDPVLASAMTDAIRRSDNCAIRRVIVGLQDRLSEGIAGTIAAFERVLEAAGAQIERRPQSAAAEQACVHYLDNHQEGLPASDLGVVPQFGTAEWTEDDAISFAHALSEGAYGKAGAYLLRLMGLPKEPPLEEPQQPSAPPLDWGAGAVFPGSWKPAWKAGWGGSQDQPPHYLGGQIAVLHLGALPVAATAVFVPRIEPPNDNPGLTRAPQAIELMFKGARAGLEREHVGGIE
jgi:hypothetical protein